MKRAVVFDLFETLVTEWGHEKYTKRKMSSDLQCPSEDFARCWETLHEQQYRGEITFQDSALAPLVDHLILSYETGLCKPQPEIYQLAAEKLGVTCEDCVFIGDGGSRELYGAAQVGMQPYRAMWYIRQMPHPIKEQPEFSVLEMPMDVLHVL